MYFYCYYDDAFHSKSKYRTLTQNTESKIFLKPAQSEQLYQQGSDMLPNWFLWSISKNCTF